MNQSISCITPRGNVYTINKDKKLLYLTHIVGTESFMMTMTSGLPA